MSTAEDLLYLENLLYFQRDFLYAEGVLRYVHTGDSFTYREVSYGYRGC